MVEARTRERGGFLPTFLTMTVIRAALMEASGFLFLIAYMVEGNRLALFLAALAALHLAAIFPSRGAYDRFLAALEDSGSRPR